ncbi:MAG: hypothetical protein JWM74_4337 [Myxococcaceae bacterium]|nr:hypothetical protein [Myxococcaceae bacterium]
MRRAVALLIAMAALGHLGCKRTKHDKSSASSGAGAGETEGPTAKADDIEALQRSAAENERLAEELTRGMEAKRPADGKTAKTPAQPAQPAQPALAATGGIPAGKYNCHGYSSQAGGFAVLRRVVINGASYVLFTLNDRQQLPGTYRLDGTVVTWVTGPLVAKKGDYMIDGTTKQPVLVFLDGGTAFRCYLSTG